MKKSLPTLVILLAVLVSTLVAVTAQRAWHVWADRKRVQAEAVTEAREVRQAPLFEVAPAPVPSGLPFVPAADGGAGTVVDLAALRSLLLHQKYAELNAAFESIQAAFEQNPALERSTHDAADAFAVAEAPLTAVLGNWVEATPGHFAPYLARGGNLVSLAYARRGARYTKDTPEADLAAMAATLPPALADLDRALALRPRLVAAQRQRMFAFRAQGERHGREAFDAARSACPTCLGVAVTWVYSLTPRWGGSYEKMLAFAGEQSALGVPDAKLLLGFVHVDRAQLLVLDGKDDQALAEIAHAFQYGEHADFYLERAEIEERQRRYAVALVDADRAMALAPRMLGVTRARILASMHEWEKAAEQLLRALRIDAADSKARSLREYLVGHLVYEGWESHKTGDRGRALRFLDLAAELSPGDPDIGRRRAWAVIGVAASGAKEAATAGPETPTGKGDDAFREAQRKDYELARERRFAEILPIWDRYLSLHPGDGPAHLERGGTYFNLGRRAEAHADAQRACDLGVNEGCVRARQIQP